MDYDDGYIRTADMFFFETAEHSCGFCNTKKSRPSVFNIRADAEDSFNRFIQRFQFQANKMIVGVEKEEEIIDWCFSVLGKNVLECHYKSLYNLIRNHCAICKPWAEPTFVFTMIGDTLGFQCKNCRKSCPLF
jgi:hypothetical protein